MPDDPHPAGGTPAGLLENLLTVDEVEAAAQKVLPRLAWDYYRSGADAEQTLDENRRAFGRLRLWPRVLVDVSQIRLATRLLGREIASPILIAPTAYHRLATPEGELATARAAAGTIYCLSTLATTSIEDVAAVATGPCWFQLYVHRDRGFTRALVERAVAAGHEALVLTVDTPVLGRRLADEHNGFALPAPLCMENLVEAVPPELKSGLGDRSALGKWFAARHDATLTWKDLEWLRSLSELPVLVKGVLRADDAVRAVEHGAAGVIVSNHGARQLDGVPATIEALPEVVEAVGALGRGTEVLLDGGIRWGTDVLKALALGARAVLVGRPVLWGLAVGGEAGVRHVLGILENELARAMALAGCPAVDAVERDLVRPAPR